MAKEKKKQHYVPQAYLESWSVPDKHQVYVYNKMQRKTYLTGIDNIANERYFYDIDFTGILTEEDLKAYGISSCDPKHIDDGQYIENFFANRVENYFKQQLNSVIQRIAKMTPWEINNCVFMSPREKFLFSFHLALQFIRVKSVRNAMTDSADCLEQVLHDMGATQQVIDKYALPKSQLPFTHGQMILNQDRIEELSQCFFTLTWILQVNRTSQPFYTSDSPIGTKAHVQHPFMSMAGLKSKGVEAYFPISPELMLVMLDGDYHTSIKEFDRRIVELSDLDSVKDYNSRCILHSDTCVFSKTDNFSLIEEMLSKNPDILDMPHTVVRWGGKTYSPRRE